jgi:hypothetical protein
MTGKIAEKLRSLLKSYDERAAGRPPTEVRATPDEGERRRQACGDRLQNVARPVLQAFVTELKSAGHEGSIEDRTDTADAYPSVGLMFRPRAPGRVALASTLTFRYDPRRGIAVVRDIKPSGTKGRVVTTSTDRIGTMRVEAVTPEWVETKTLSFIEAVLKVN